MIDKIHRFQGHGSLRFAYQKGQTVRGQYCSLKFIRNRRRKTYRVAVVVSRKVHKSAVVRNRIRRRIYEIIRLESGRIATAYDLIFTAYNDQLAAMPHHQLREIIVYELEKAGAFATDAPRQPAGHDIVESKEK